MARGSQPSDAKGTFILGIFALFFLWHLVHYLYRSFPPLLIVNSLSFTQLVSCSTFGDSKPRYAIHAILVYDGESYLVPHPSTYHEALFEAKRLFGPRDASFQNVRSRFDVMREVSGYGRVRVSDRAWDSYETLDSPTRPPVYHLVPSLAKPYADADFSPHRPSRFDLAVDSIYGRLRFTSYAWPPNVAVVSKPQAYFVVPAAGETRGFVKSAQTGQNGGDWYSISPLSRSSARSSD
ncbi:hypothetical protein JCM8547_006075 [Rhodosporidiobolus lusitaniae]